MISVSVEPGGTPRTWNGSMVTAKARLTHDDVPFKHACADETDAGIRLGFAAHPSPRDPDAHGYVASDAIARVSPLTRGSCGHVVTRRERFISEKSITEKVGGVEVLSVSFFD